MKPRITLPTNKAIRARELRWKQCQIIKLLTARTRDKTILWSRVSPSAWEISRGAENLSCQLDLFARVLAPAPEDPPHQPVLRCVQGRRPYRGIPNWETHSDLIINLPELGTLTAAIRDHEAMVADLISKMIEELENLAA